MKRPSENVGWKMLMKNDEADIAIGDQSIQAESYSFPYHYVPQIEKKLRLSRHWRFGASYVAALNLVAERLKPVARAKGPEWRHIDIGCGDGALIHYLSGRSEFSLGIMSGVDLDQRAIEWAKMFNPTAMLHTGDLANLGAKHHSASLIEVLEHIPPDALPNFVASAAQLLLPRGSMVVTVPSVEKALAKKHYQHFNFNTIRRVLDSQFDEISIVGFERRDLICRWVNNLRGNRFFHLDMPVLNEIEVRRLQRVHLKQNGCGRLLVTCRRKKEGH